MGKPPHLTLIDTGANISLININQIKNMGRVVPVQTRIKSASGSLINILGVIENIKIKVHDEEITFSPVVYKGQPEYTILGVDVIVKYQKLVENIMGKWSSRININSHASQKKTTHYLQPKKKIDLRKNK
ncbi:hypothetical protein NGRA_2748 [Nosema granulosis]|uniref:Retropepsins domain-containing protein n=1 Tax=Nosema granulosis TaxID=83296 RepID=A0A9P6GW26_9MICR|nr:hypothetical protein NGRA_2748 [Nosema granulosis]